MTIGRIPSVEGGIQPTIVDAKGDLIAGVAADSINRLAVGTNGTVLTADSSTSTGLAWTGVNQMVNPVINGGMDIWQRGTSFSNITAAPYTADRFQASIGSMTSGTLSVSRQTSAPTGLQYAARFQRNSGATTTGSGYFTYSLDSASSIPMQGKTMTISFYARAGANYSPSGSGLTFVANTGTGTDENINNGFTGSVNVITQTATLTTSWQRFAYSFSFGSTANQLGFYWQYTGVGTAGANDWFEVTGVQLDIGTYTASTAPTFRRSGGTIQGELAACQRYYVRMGANSGGTAETYSNYGSGYSVDASNITAFSALPVQMRVRPTAIEYANLAIQDFAAAVIAVSALTLNTSQSSFTVGTVNGTVSGSTTARGCKLLNNNNNAGYLAFSAEL